jgi:hypothetical protein
MDLTARFPADAPMLAGQPVWVVLIAVLFAISATSVLNNFVFAWLRGNAPQLFRPRVLLMMLAVAGGIIIFGITINPPSEVRKRMPLVSATAPP